MAGKLGKHRPHRLTHEEHPTPTHVKVGSLEPGDVFVRQGTPHLVVSMPQTVRDVDPTWFASVTWIVNMHTGGCWAVPNDELVHPAQEVRLRFTSSRREQG